MQSNIKDTDESRQGESMVLEGKEGNSKNFYRKLRLSDELFGFRNRGFNPA